MLNCVHLKSYAQEFVFPCQKIHGIQVNAIVNWNTKTFSVPLLSESFKFKGYYVDLSNQNSVILVFSENEVKNNKVSKNNGLLTGVYDFINSSNLGNYCVIAKNGIVFKNYELKFDKSKSNITNDNIGKLGGLVIAQNEPLLKKGNTKKGNTKKVSTRQNSTKQAPAPVIKTFAKIEDVTVKHKEKFFEGEGMTIDMKLTVSGKKGERVKVIAFFYDENGNKITSTISGYQTNENTLCSYKSAESTYDTSVWNHFTLELPYYAMILTNGRHNIKFFIEVRTLNDKAFATSEWYSTTIDYSLGNIGRWRSKITSINAEFVPFRIKQYIERPLCLAYKTTYQDCMNEISRSSLNGWINKKQIQANNRKSQWPYGFMGLETSANIFFKDKGKAIDYYDYNFRLPKSQYSKDDAIALCYLIQNYAEQAGYILISDHKDNYSATCYHNMKQVNLSIGEYTGENAWGVCLRITPH